MTKKETPKLKEMKDGYVPDLATGRPVDFRKPEEVVRQEYERILQEDYDYSYKQMDIEVHIQRGSKKKPSGKKDFADIVIYKTNDKRKRDQNEDILAIVETKRPNRKDGIRQLMSYMSASCGLVRQPDSSPNMGKRWSELLLPISKEKKERARITKEMKQVFDQKFAAKALVHEIKKKFGNLTT